jgi:hypothetical protein
MLYTDIRPIPGDFVTKIAPLAELANRRPRLYREMTLSPVFSSCIKHHHGCSNILGDSRAKWISITMAN